MTTESQQEPTFSEELSGEELPGGLFRKRSAVLTVRPGGKVFLKASYDDTPQKESERSLGKAIKYIQKKVSKIKGKKGEKHKKAMMRILKKANRLVIKAAEEKYNRMLKGHYNYLKEKYKLLEKEEKKIIPPVEKPQDRREAQQDPVTARRSNVKDYDYKGIKNIADELKKQKAEVLQEAKALKEQLKSAKNFYKAVNEFSNTISDISMLQKISTDPDFYKDYLMNPSILSAGSEIGLAGGVTTHNFSAKQNLMSSLKSFMGIKPSFQKKAKMVQAMNKVINAFKNTNATTESERAVEIQPQVQKNVGAAPGSPTKEREEPTKQKRIDEPSSQESPSPKRPRFR